MRAGLILTLGTGIIHCDLSESNILLGIHGPAIIDLPQAVNAAGSGVAAATLDRVTEAALGLLGLSGGLGG